MRNRGEALAWADKLSNNTLSITLELFSLGAK
jgi:hypothetical protein